MSKTAYATVELTVEVTVDIDALEEVLGYKPDVAIIRGHILHSLVGYRSTEVETGMTDKTDSKIVQFTIVEEKEAKPKRGIGSY